MSFEWSEDNIEIMRRMLSEGAYTREIAAVLGTTKNAVVGKIDRLKNEGVLMIKPIVPKPRPKRRPKNGFDIVEIPFTGACKFPIADATPSTPYRFCGAPSASTYCATHGKVVFSRYPR